jgi:hypothetical protein
MSIRLANSSLPLLQIKVDGVTGKVAVRSGHIDERLLISSVSSRRLGVAPGARATAEEGVF